MAKCWMWFSPAWWTILMNDQGNSKVICFSLLNSIFFKNHPFSALRAPFPWSEAEYPKGIGEGLGMGLFIDHRIKRPLECTFRLPLMNEQVIGAEIAVKLT